MSSPGLSAESCNKARPSMPAATRRTIASAISDTTKAECKRCVPAVTVRAPARRICSTSRTGARQAGAKPQRRLVNRITAMAKSSTRQSSCTSSARGKSPGQKATKGPRPAFASSTPRIPPARPSNALSVKHCRTKRPRPAPRATRMANSRSREIARASIRLATLAHAISKTSPTAPRSSQSVGPTSPTGGWSCLTSSERPLFVSAKV